MRTKIIGAVCAISMLAVPAVSAAAPAKDAAVQYVGGSCGGSQDGSVSVNKGVATINVPDAQSYGIIRAYPAAGLKVKDLKTLSFKSLSSAGGHMVYMQVITDQGNRIKYTPSEQTPPLVPEPGIGSWYTHSPMTSGVRTGMPEVNDSAPTETWAQAVSELGNDTVNRVAITAGCSFGHGTVQVDRLQVNDSVISFK